MKKGDVLKVLERHKMLTLALEREITQAEAARELRLSLPHTKKLIKRLKETGGSYEALLYRRNHPAPNRLPEDIRGKVVALKRENRGRSNPLIADLIFDEVGVRVHPNTVRNILLERGEYSRCYCRRPSRRFEMSSFGQLVQMDTSSGAWLEGYRRIYLVLILDDFSRTILAARFFDSDSTYNNMLVLREAIEGHGIFPILYSDNDSKFKLIRYEGSRFFTYSEETLVGEVVTELHRALLELGVTLITHLPGNARAKGKIERLFRFIQERFISEHTAKTLDGLNLDDVFCLKQERKVAKDNSFSLDGVTYAIPREHNMVAFKVKLHIHPGIKIRVWYKDEFLCELTHIIKQAKDKRRIMFFDPPRVSF